MDTFNEDYLNYDEMPPKFEANFGDFDFSTTSPNSDSLLYPSYHSPGSNDPYFSTGEQLGYTLPRQTVTEHQDFYSQQAVSTRGPQTPEADIRLQAHSEDSTEKTSRVLKRKIAKDRAKTKKGATPIFADIDSKFIPEGYDDPDLDENTRKKMTQMIRNRISAQNSRDRRKNYITQLEEINQRLTEENTQLAHEKTALLDKIRYCEEREVALLQENMSLRQNNICLTCRGQQSIAIGEYSDQVQQDEPAQGSGESFTGGFSNLSSPILSRLPSGGRGFFTFFTFMAMLSLIAVMNIHQATPGTVLLSSGPIQNNRILELNEMNIINPIEQITFRLKDLPYNTAQILTNIRPLRKNFDMNHHTAFKAHMDKLPVYGDTKDAKELYLLPVHESKSVVAAYGQSVQRNFRRAAPTIMAQNRPVGGEIAVDNKLSSTLFCPAGIEFYDSTAQVAELGMMNKLDVERAEYLQFLVPRSSIARFDMNNNTADTYGFPVQLDGGNDNTMLEIWCKVFSIRELQSN